MTVERPDAEETPSPAPDARGGDGSDGPLELRVAVSAARLGIWRASFIDETVVSTHFGGPITGLPDAPRNLDQLVSLIHPDDRERVGRAVQAAAAGEAAYRIDFRIQPPGGELRWVHARGEVVRDAAGRPLALVGVDMDITERKRAEEERLKLEERLQRAQRLESLGVLAGGVAHDFNNLLVGILGNAELALDDLPARPHEARELVQEIKSAALRAAALTAQMLAYSGKGRFLVAPVDVNTLIEELLPLLRVAVGRAAVLRHELAPGLPAILADAEQLRQVAMNLITNAAEATEAMGGVIGIRTDAIRVDGPAAMRSEEVEALPPGEYVRLQISDTGCGMDEATQQRIFDPFFTTKFTGRGLGLASVQGIVRGHHGGLRVRSAPGAGTTIEVLLPCADEQPAPLAAEEPTPATEATSTTSTIVLVIDDEPTVRDVIAKGLDTAGFLALSAVDGAQGLALFAQHADRLALVLLDMTMPGPPCEETLAALRRQGAQVPVVLMSGYSEAEIARRFAGQGLAGFLQKPFRIGQLLELVRRVASERG